MVMVVEVPVPVTVGSQEQEFICVEQSQTVVVAVGQQGPPGPDGKTAYQVWLEEGYTGSESDFFSFLKGAKGDRGDQGDRGLPGAASPTYVHDQTVPLNVWVINHPMSKFPSVTCMEAPSRRSSSMTPPNTTPIPPCSTAASSSARRSPRTRRAMSSSASR